MAKAAAPTLINPAPAVVPLALAEVIGNRPTVHLLQRLRAVGRLPHALLLDGIPGSGRRTLALALAKSLLCHAVADGDACGQCVSCREMEAGYHPDVVMLPHDSEQGELPVDLVRTVVVAAASETALHGHGRVFLIPGVERLRPEGANALLKVLEEPIPGTTLIMTTSAGDGLLRTIRSRVQRFRMRPLLPSEVEAVLLRQGTAAAEAKQLARHSTGSHRELGNHGLGPPRLQDLRRLLGGGYDSSLIAAVMEQIQSESAQIPASTPAGQVRAALRRWLDAMLIDLRHDLNKPEGESLIPHIERVLQAQRDLRVNLHPRLVLDGLALP